MLTIMNSMGCLRRLFCCCCPEDNKEYVEYENYRAYPGPRVTFPDPKVDHPQYLSRRYDAPDTVVINGGSQDSVFGSIREKLSSWSLPKSNSTLITERVQKFDEFLDEEYANQESFINQDAVSVTSRLSEIFE